MMLKDELKTLDYIYSVLTLVVIPLPLPVANLQSSFEKSFNCILIIKLTFLL